jgi:trimethylamine--corrinoid protein Co-methyltransferase
MADKGGLRVRPYRIFTEEEVKKIDEGVMWTLSEVGIEVNSEQAWEIFKGAGATTEPGSKIVKLPRAMVEDAIDKAPSQVVLHGRDSKYDLYLEDSRVYFGTGGTVLFILDLETGEKRKTTVDDIANVGRLVDALENIHFYLLPLYPNELQKDDVDINRFYAGLKNTKKHIMGGIYTMEGLKQVIEMASMVAGGEDKLREAPFISFITLVIPPLRLDRLYTDLMIEIARHGLPVAIPSEVLAGASGPMTLAGSLVVQLAESLAGITLTQLVNPGTPTILGSVASVMDMKSSAYLSGAIEMGLMQAGVAQMAQYYQLPLYSTAGMSDSKLPDIQAGYEKALTSLLVGLAGANFIHDAAGPLEFCMSVAYEQYVIDNEIIGMVMRTVRGIEVNDETLALDAIREIGPGGNFLIHPNTLKHMRTELFEPQVADRQLRERWEAAGAKDARERAREIARDILLHHEPHALDGELDEQIQSRFPNITLSEQDEAAKLGRRKILTK